MKPRTSKIARLPQSIRDQLNSRLSDGQFGSELLDWLNALPEVQDILKRHFDAAPITKQNLSEWKNTGGYQDWLLHQHTLELAERLSEQTHDLQSTLNPCRSRREEAQTLGPESEPVSEPESAPLQPTLPDKLALWLTARYMVLSQQFARTDTLDDDAWKRLQDLTRNVIALRRGEHQSQRLKLQREQFDHSVKDDMTLAWNVCVDHARGHRDVMDRLRGAINLLNKRKNRDYRDYEADGETLRVRPLSPVSPISKSPAQSNPVQPSNDTAPTNPSIHQSNHPVPSRHSEFVIHPSRPTCTADSTPESPAQSRSVQPSNGTDDDVSSGDTTHANPSIHESNHPASAESPSESNPACRADLPRRSKAEAGAQRRRVPDECPSESNPVHPSDDTDNGLSSNDTAPINPIIHQSNHPAPAPAPTREELLAEADNTLWRMKSGFEPWDMNNLRQVYSVIPPLWDDPPVPYYKKDLTPDQLRQEAEQCLDRMRRNFVPWDHEVLRRYFSAVPSPWPVPDNQP